MSDFLSKTEIMNTDYLEEDEVGFKKPKVRPFFPTIDSYEN